MGNNMTELFKKDPIRETYRLFYSFPLYQANVSKILINKASHSETGSTLLHLFDLSHLNLKTKRIFLIDFLNHKKSPELFFRMAILDNVDGYRPFFIYVDKDYFDAEHAEENNSIFLNQIRKNFNLIESDIYKRAKDFANQKDITLNNFLENNPIDQSFLSLLNDDNHSNIFPKDDVDIDGLDLNEDYQPYPEIYIVAHSNTSSYNVVRDFSSNLFEMSGNDKRDVEDILYDFYYRVLKCVTDDAINFPDKYFYHYSLDFINYNFAYFTVDNSVYYFSYNTGGAFIEKRLADDDALPKDFESFSTNKNIAFKDKYKFLAYQAKVNQFLKKYEIERLNKAIIKFDYDEIKNSICKQIDLATEVLNKRNDVIKAKIDSFNDIEVV